MTESVNATNAAVGLLLAGIASVPVLLGAAWALPAPYIWIFAGCWTVSMAGFVAVIGFDEPTERSCKYCGEPVGDDDA